jgi:hypothetical protein
VPPTLPSRKWLFLAPVGVVLTLALGWIGGILYWHFRVSRTLSSWTQDFATTQRSIHDHHGISNETAVTLRIAGCRALPRLVRMLNDSRDPYLREGIVLYIAGGLSPKEGSLRNPVTDSYDYFRWRWHFSADKSELENQQILEDVNAWWVEHGKEYHQGWRFWSSECHPPPPRTDSNP